MLDIRSFNVVACSRKADSADGPLTWRADLIEEASTVFILSFSAFAWTRMNQMARLKVVEFPLVADRGRLRCVDLIHG